MSTELDDLRYTIHREHCLERVHGDDCLFWKDDEVSAAAVLAAGYRKQEP